MIMNDYESKAFSGCELDPCLNGGVCVMSGQNRTCVCPANANGLYCENSKCSKYDPLWKQVP